LHNCKGRGFGLLVNIISMSTLQELNKVQLNKIFLDINTIIQNIGETSIYQEVLYRQLEEVQKELKEIYPSILK